MRTDGENKSIWLVSYENGLDPRIYRPYMRTCDTAYDDVLKILRGQAGGAVELGGICYQFQAGETPAKIILDLLIKGVLVDFHEIDDENCNTLSITDVRTGKNLKDAG